MKISAAWRKKRAEVIKRADGLCDHCLQEMRHMNVHHRYYEAGKKNWDYDLVSLEYLCDRCHGNADEMRRRLVRAIGMMPAVEDEMTLAYLEARGALVGMAKTLVIRVDSMKQAQGIAMAIGARAVEVLATAKLSKNRQVNVIELCAKLRSRTA